MNYRKPHLPHLLSGDWGVRSGGRHYCVFHGKLNYRKNETVRAEHELLFRLSIILSLTIHIKYIAIL